MFLAAFSALLSSTAPPTLSKAKSDRQIEKKKAWEQGKGLLWSGRPRPRGPTLDATLEAIQISKENYKQILVPSGDIDKKESQL